MIQPSLINFSTLPSVSLEKRTKLPVVSAIYFAIDSVGTIQYIGRSINLNQRWRDNGHHQIERLRQIGAIRITWLEVADSSLLPSIEVALLQYFNPPLNRIPSSGKRKKPVDSRIEFRDAALKEKIHSLGFEPSQFAKTALNRVLEFGRCPVCLKPFDECKYFQQI